MIDSKTLVQEVQKELSTAVQRGQEQVRKSQEQLRKSRETVTGVVTGLAKSVRPGGAGVRLPNPAEVRAHAQELAEHAITVQRDLAGKARHAASPYAERVMAAQRDFAERARHANLSEHVAAAQRTLAGKMIEVAKVATPLVAEGRARLTQVVGGRHDAAQPEPTADGTGATTRLHAVDGSQPAADEAAPATPAPAAPETATPETAAPAPKARATKANATKASTSKAGTNKAGTHKPRTTKK